MPKRKNDGGHAVERVEIKGSQVKVICSCGWKSKVAKTESAARDQHDAHSGAK